MRRLLSLVLLLAGCPANETRERAIERPVHPVIGTSTAVDYRVSFPERQAHYVAVEGTFPTDGRQELVLMMPVWTPGSYLVREFSRNVHDLEARSSKGKLAATKLAKNRWRIALDGSPVVAVTYRLYARQANVRENFVDRDVAVLNGAPTFFADAAHLDRTYRVKIELPAEWKQATCTLPAEEGRFVAESYDRLVDSPIVAGSPAVHRFEIEGVEHLLVNTDEGTVWDGARSAADVEKIARAEIGFWGVLPYPRYVFFNVINEGRGGLEHQNGTVIMSSRWRTRNDDDYRGWLATIAHEHFHAWNGKRLRPIALGPFDYEQEVYTPDLWIVEGLTSYYDQLLLVRAGLMDETQWLAAMSRDVEAHELAPGRLHDSLAASSFDAWIEFYRWDENSNNTTVSYYTKGAVVGFLIDAVIRRETNDAKSLDDVMREAYRRWSGAKGYTTAEFYGLVDELAGKDARDLLVRMVETTDELEYEPAFDWYGLEFEPPSDEKPKALLGAKTEAQNGRTIVLEVTDRSPAYDAGLSVGDEVLAIDGYRVDDLPAHLGRYQPNDRVKLLVSRRGALVELALKLGEKPRQSFKLRPEKMRSAVQIQRFHKLIIRSP